MKARCIVFVCLTLGIQTLKAQTTTTTTAEKEIIELSKKNGNGCQIKTQQP